MTGPRVSVPRPHDERFAEWLRELRAPSDATQVRGVGRLLDAPPEKDGLGGLVKGARDFVRGRVEDMRSPSPLPQALLNPNPTPEQRSVLMDNMAAVVGSVGAASGRVASAVKKAAGGVGEMAERYFIKDRLTGDFIGKPYNNFRRARTRVDKLDNDYGAYRYHVVPESQIKR